MHALHHIHLTQNNIYAILVSALILWMLGLLISGGLLAVWR